MRGAVASLRERREVINNLNVFPVPDGDTGTNLLLTMEAAEAALEGEPPGGTGAQLAALAHGALMGSRGNSGIILSQLLEGLAAGIPAGAARGAAESLIRGIAEGVKLAYGSVREPVEGTMLTVAREVSEGLQASSPGTLSELLRIACRLAAESLDRTPLMLAALADAGVVDAGGAGLVAMLEGITGAPGEGAQGFDWERHSAVPVHVEYGGPGSGIVFLIDCAPEEVALLESRLSPMGDSLLVAGAAPPYRVHIHTDSTDRVLAAVRSFGEVTGVRTADFSGLAAGAQDAGTGSSPVAVLAYSVSGQLASAFAELGARVTGSGWPGHQPGTGDVLQAVRGAGAEVVIVLPNDTETFKVALMARKLGDGVVLVVPAVTPVQGLAAMEEFTEDDPEKLFSRMERRARRVRNGHAARAVRDARVDGVDVSRGQVVGFVEGRASFAGDDIDQVALRVCSELLDSGGTVLTLVGGPGIESDRPGITGELGRRYPGLDIEWYEAPHRRYELLVGLE